MNQKKATIKDVALKANVSKATVSYVLNNVDKVSEETKKKVLKAMEELNYTPSSTARNLAKNNEVELKDHLINENPFYLEFVQSYVGTQVQKESIDGKSQILKTIESSGVIPSLLLKQLKKQSQIIIGIVLSIEGDYKQEIFRSNPVYQEFISGAEDMARHSHIILKVMYADELEDKDSEFHQYNFMGFIVFGKVKDIILDLLDKRKTPLVHVDDYCEDRKHTHVLSNDREGAFQGVKYLIDCGYRNIGFVGGIANYCSVNQNRYDGYKEALFQYDVSFNKNNVFIVPGHAYEYGIEIAKTIIERKDKLDALFCISDITAIGVMKGLRQGGIAVPDEMAVLGFDNIQASKYCYPELTTINQHIYEKGKITVTLLVDQIKGNTAHKEHIIPVSIMERESIKIKG